VAKYAHTYIRRYTYKKRGEERRNEKKEKKRGGERENFQGKKVKVKEGEGGLREAPPSIDTGHRSKKKGSKEH